MNFLSSQREGPKELLSSIDRDVRTLEVMTVAGDDGFRPDLPGGLVEDSILEIGEIEIQRRLEDRAVDRRNIEDRQELADFAARRHGTQHLRRQVVDRGDGRGADVPGEIPDLGTREQLGGGCRERRTVEEKVEDDVGVEEDLQRYLSSRCRR
jgi:hypothetical protein